MRQIGVARKNAGDDLVATAMLAVRTWHPPQNTLPLEDLPAREIDSPSATLKESAE
jgi:hypothetical protein